MAGPVQYANSYRSTINLKVNDTKAITGNEARPVYFLVSKAQPGVCLTASDRRRLDGFQCKCIRRILRIPPAFYSRVSNKIVMERAGHITASRLLLERQLVLLGKVIRAPQGSPLQTATFIPNSSPPATTRYFRRVGRPRMDGPPQCFGKPYI